MKIKLIISVLLGLGVVVCATPYKDSVTIFHIKGRVLDQASNFPLEDVNVYFIDTGYDDTFSKQQKPFKIGQSTFRGKINIRFNYWWGRQTSAFAQRPKATFDIILSRASFAEQRFHFKESALKTDGVTFLVDLEDVYLDRKNE
jgi:hypothetical protein